MRTPKRSIEVMSVSWVPVVSLDPREALAERAAIDLEACEVDAHARGPAGFVSQVPGDLVLAGGSRAGEQLAHPAAARVVDREAHVRFVRQPEAEREQRARRV